MDRRALRVCRYVRVSRLDHDPRLQEDETLAFVEGRGWNLEYTCIDHGVSGSREKRPAPERMMSGAKKWKFDALLIWRSDRLFRFLRDMVRLMALGERPLR